MEIDLRKQTGTITSKVRRLHPAFIKLEDSSAYYEARMAISERAFGKFISIHYMDESDMQKYIQAGEQMLRESVDRKFNRAEFQYQMDKDTPPFLREADGSL